MTDNTRGPKPGDSRHRFGSGYIKELDGLRGIAISLVMLHHFWPVGRPWSRLSDIVHFGWVGVDLFFVVSGTLIAGILLDTRTDTHYFRNFYARRALRIFPLYYLFVASLFVIVPAVQGGPFSESEFVRQSGSPLWYVFYLGNGREALTGTEPAYFLAPLWSLSIEEQFYLLFPLVVYTASVQRLSVIMWILIAAAPIYRTVTLWWFPGNERIQYLSTPSRMDVLAFGVLIAIGLRFYRRMPDLAIVGRVLLILAAVCAVVFSIDGFDRTGRFTRTVGYSVIAAFFGALVLWTILAREQRATAWLRFGPLCYVGQICYGTYLLHRPCEVLISKVAAAVGLPLDPTSIMSTVVKVCFAIGVASSSWYLFERKVLAFKRRFESPRHPQLGDAATSSAPLGGGEIALQR